MIPLTEITSRVLILRADDEIEHFEFEGRTFAGDSGHEVFIHHIYQELPDEWLPADQICIRMSDPEYDARFAAEIAKQGMIERNHVDCDFEVEEISKQQVLVCPECTSSDVTPNSVDQLLIGQQFECNDCGHEWS